MENSMLIIKAQIQISKPAAVVYNAIIDPAEMTNYFISKSSGFMTTGVELIWQFPEFDMEVPVRVGEVRKDEYVSFYWDDIDGKKMLVEINLVPIGESTHVIVTEKERIADEAGTGWLGRNTEGWANFLACMKAYLEYGINLRKGAFSFMST